MDLDLTNLDESHMEPSSNQNPALSRVPVLDRDKNITFLLKELDSLRAFNSKLQEQLVQKEKELQRKEFEEQLQQEQMEQKIWRQPTELVQQLMASQKEREQAMMSRLLLANEERDQALFMAQRLAQAAANQFESLESDSMDNSDLDVMELLNRVCDADSVQQVEQFGPILVQHVRLAQQRRSDITAQEMTAVMEERDANASKVKHLEEDQQRDLSSLRAELLKLQRERDSAVGERRRLEAELQELTANQRFSRSEAPPPETPAEDVTVKAPASLGDDVTALQEQLVMMSQQKKNVEAELLQSNERIRR